MALASGQYDYTGPQRQNGGAKPVYGPPQHEFGEPIEEPQQSLPPQSQPQPQQPAEQAEAYTPQLFKHVGFMNRCETHSVFLYCRSYFKRCHIF